MGNIVPRSKQQSSQPKKRSREEESETATEELFSFPQRKRIKTTSTYIFETLFENGTNSDVTIKALGKEWHLHKVYLRQVRLFRIY
jgi:BTB/POZ domain-containing protein 13